jgi:Zinc knuckle
MRRLYSSLFPPIHHHLPSSAPSLTHLVRFHRFMSCPMQSLISCNRFILSKQKKKKFTLKKKVVKNMAGARGCFNCGGCAWCFCVVTVVVSPCVQTHVPTPLFPPSFSRPWCGADGDRDLLLYIDRAQSNCYRKTMLCASCSCRKKQSDTRLRTAQRRGHPLGNDYPSCSDQMTRSRGLLTRFLFLAITVSPIPPSFLGSLGLLLVCRVRDGGAGGMEGHVSRDCSMEQKAKSCYRCGQEGHIVRSLSSISL